MISLILMISIIPKWLRNIVQQCARTTTDICNSDYCIKISAPSSEFAVTCFAKKAALFRQVQGLRSLSSLLMSLPMPLPLFASTIAQKGVRRLAQGFSCRFHHFLLRFSKNFPPCVIGHFSTFSIAWFLPEGAGGVWWHAATLHWLQQKLTPRNCLQMNELS